MAKKSLRDLGQVLGYLKEFTTLGTQKNHQGRFGLDRSRLFLKLLGNPQEKLKIIHIAGTSGKGSTAYLTSIILGSLGFKTGLHLSPHLIDIRERCQVGNSLLAEGRFVRYFNDIIPVIDKMRSSRYGKPTYFEIMVGLSYYIFLKEDVDYAVIETGMGGAFDATNVVRNEDKVSVLTKIGKDHTEILGKRLVDIASQKAGIINRKSIVICAHQRTDVRKVISACCRKKHARLFYLSGNEQVKLNLHGNYQEENCSLALKIVSLLGKADGFKIDRSKIDEILMSARFPGRFDIIDCCGKTLILDGAHNPQKMSAFTSSLRKRFPHTRFHFLLAFKRNKDFSKMLKYITPIAGKITLTSFFVDDQDLEHLSVKPSEISAMLKTSGYMNYALESDDIAALESSLKDKSDVVVVTGSLYLLSEIYSYMIRKGYCY